MAAMYGSVKGNKGEVHRLGSNYLRTVAATWQGAIETVLTRRQSDGAIEYVVRRIPWQGSDNTYGSIPIASGVLANGPS